MRAFAVVEMLALRSSLSWSGHILTVMVMQGMEAEAAVEFPAIGGICVGIDTPRARLCSRCSGGVESTLGLIPHRPSAMTMIAFCAGRYN